MRPPRIRTNVNRKRRSSIVTAAFRKQRSIRKRKNSFRLQFSHCHILIKDTKFRYRLSTKRLERSKFLSRLLQESKNRTVTVEASNGDINALNQALYYIANRTWSCTASCFELQRLIVQLVALEWPFSAIIGDEGLYNRFGANK